MKRPQGDAALVLTRADGQKATVTVTLRIDTTTEVEYYQQGWHPAVRAAPVTPVQT